jgi:hypothetical protein
VNRATRSGPSRRPTARSAHRIVPSKGRSRPAHLAFAQRSVAGDNYRRGLVLLEVMVALIILTLAGAGALQLAHQSHLLADNSRDWSAAVAAAEDGMELAKLGSAALHGPPGDPLPGGFRRQITRRPLASPDGFEQVTVTVFLPGGGRFGLERLARIADDGTERW